MPLSSGRFTVRYFRKQGFEAAGYAVCDRGHRIGIIYPTWDEAEAQRKRIAEHYLREGW